MKVETQANSVEQQWEGMLVGDFSFNVPVGSLAR